MSTRLLYPALACLLLAVACTAPRGSRSSTAIPLIEDQELCLHTAMAAVAWSKLHPSDRELWSVVWDTAIALQEAPTQTYCIEHPDGTQARLNLFERSPKDGYCVAFAHYQTGRMAKDNICVSFLSHAAPSAARKRP